MKKFKIKKVKYKPATYNGKPVRLLSGHMVYSGTIQVLVNEVPKASDFEFKRIGKFLFAERDGFVKIFKHEPGSKDGFGGWELTLNVGGDRITYKGCLWDPMGFDDMSNVPEYRSVSITDDPEVMKVGYTFYSGYVTKKLYEKLCKKAGVKLLVGSRS